MPQQPGRRCAICNAAPAFPVYFDAANGRFWLDMCASDAHEMAPVIRRFWRDVAAHAAPPKD